MCEKPILATVDTIDSSGCIILQVSYIPTHYRCAYVSEISIVTSRMVTHCTFHDEELDIYLDIAFISKSTRNEAGALKPVSTGVHEIVGNDGSCCGLSLRENGAGLCTVKIQDGYLCSILCQRSGSYSRIFDHPSRVSPCENSLFQ